MNQYQSIAEIKDYAKDRLAGRFGNSAILTLLNTGIVFGITFLISTVISILTLSISLVTTGDVDTGKLSISAILGIGLLQYLLTLLCSIFTGIFNTGISLYFLNLASGRNATLGNLYYGFQYLYKKSLALSTVTVLISSVCLLPYDIFYFLYSNKIPGNWDICMIIAMVAGMAVYVPISLSLSQVFFLLLDFPTRSPKELLSLSIRLMKGRKWKLFKLQLSFLPLMILGVLSFGIGNLWITPYMNMTMALYFLDIMKSGDTASDS